MFQFYQHYTLDLATLVYGCALDGYGGTGNCIISINYTKKQMPNKPRKVIAMIRTEQQYQKQIHKLQAENQRLKQERDELWEANGQLITEAEQALAAPPQKEINHE